MFDIGLQVRLKQARNALREGRLDEAFAIVTEKKVREHRGGQALLGDLVAPLLARAASHLEGGRPKEALLDAERAIHAGGSRPEALELRQRAEEALRTRRKEREKEGELVESARRHVLGGSVRTGQELLKQVPLDRTGAERLLREAASRERRAERSLKLARDHLTRGEILEALESAEEAMSACRNHEALPELLFELKQSAIPRIEELLCQGDLRSAGELFLRIRGVVRDTLEIHRIEDIVRLAGEARGACVSGSLDALRTRLEKLRKILPAATWVEDCLDAVGRIQQGQRTLEASPLSGDFPALDADAPPDDPSKQVTLALSDEWVGKGPAGEGGLLARSPVAAPRRRSPEPETGGTRPPSKMLLWVDGVGTYMVLTSDRVSLGRAGASSRPDIALPADIAGRQAEIVRIEDDYFLVSAQGPIRVGGQMTERKLLANDDTIDLGSQCRLRFHLPTPLSSTALLSLHRGKRIDGDVRTILFLKEHLILGPKGKSHIAVGGLGKKIVLSLEPRGLVCRSSEDILVDGQTAGREATVPLGVRLQVGDVTFTVTDASGRG